MMRSADLGEGDSVIELWLCCERYQSYDMDSMRLIA